LSINRLCKKKNTTNVHYVEVFNSTTITLFKEILKGAGRNCINGPKKGGIKAFTKMNLAEGVPNFVCFKAASQNENTFLKLLKLEVGSISTFDKGFCKYMPFPLHKGILLTYFNYVSDDSSL
jgi:hypothetical protein